MLLGVDWNAARLDRRVMVELRALELAARVKGRVIIWRRWEKEKEVIMSGRGRLMS